MRAYTPDAPKYNPNKLNNGKHIDTLYFNYYSITIDGHKLWANVKVRHDGVGEQLYTIESKVPSDLIQGKYKKKE